MINKEWKYKSPKGITTGYEEVWDELAAYNKEDYDALDEQGKEDLINKIFNIYRSVNIYPIFYYTKEDIIEEIQKCRDKEFKPFDGEVLSQRPTLGNGLLKFLFPNYWLVNCKDDKNNTLYERFFNDHKLKRTIEFCLKFRPKIKTPLTPNQIRDGLQMIGGNIPTNFLPMKARILLEYYMPEGGNYFDFSCGFGSRLLGAMIANSKINYFGLEPDSETFKNLEKTKPYLIEALNLSPSQINLYKKGSEVKINSELYDSMDFAFSSPPYFNLEKYSDEGTQCYIKYNTLESWINGYVRPTIKNLYKVLKVGKYYAVNISDFKVGNDNIHFVEEWIKISEEEGFTFIKEIPMKVGRSRPNSNSKQSSYIPKVEGIYLFKKKE